jgi:hypothetical protein
VSSRAHLSLGDDLAETALDSVDAFFEKKLYPDSLKSREKFLAFRGSVDSDGA